MTFRDKLEETLLPIAVLRELRKILEVPEGESILDWATIIMERLEK
jgi:hypothetical protein